LPAAIRRQRREELNFEGNPVDFILHSTHSSFPGHGQNYPSRIGYFVILRESPHGFKFEVLQKNRPKRAETSQPVMM